METVEITNVMLIDAHLEIRSEKGIDYIRSSTMPAAFRNRIACSKQLDRNHVVTLYVCCNIWDEFILKDHFITLTRDLL